MGRRLRIQDGEHFYHISNRCFQAKFLLRPDRETNSIIRGCLARAVERHNVEVAAFVFLSNHFHIIARFPEQNMSAFMRDLQRWISGRIKRHRPGWECSVFPKRYDAQPILDTEALRDKIGYVLNNPVRHQLVTRLSRWPGVSSRGYHCGQKEYVGKWMRYRTYNRYRRQGDSIEEAERKATTIHSFSLVTPSYLSRETERTDTSPIEQLRADVKKWRLRHRKLRRRPSRGFVGRKAILKMDWKASPETPEEEDEPVCHTTDEETFFEYLDYLRKITELFRSAVQRLREGRVATFPAGTTPPGYARSLKGKTTFEPPRLATAA